jgi:hypothetical protein
MRTTRYFAITVALLIFRAVCLYGQRIDYRPIPSGFDFPASESDLLKALNSGDESKLRLHGWMVFAGLTQPARPGDPNSEAVWETWYRGDEVFAPSAIPQGLRTLQRKLTPPRQFQAAGPQPQAVGESQLAFTLFNQELRDHTRQNKLQLSATLKAINSQWTSETPTTDRKIPDYPVKAMSLKLVWMLVKKEGTTPLPIWDTQRRVINAPAQPTTTWKRVVIVDPGRDSIPVGEKKDVSFLGKQFPGSHVVSLKSFYHFPLSQDLAATIAGAAEGDFMVLTAMHFTTKEIPNWVWATFWWHDNPDDGPYAQNRPSDMVLRGVWRNYLMDVSYDMDRPRESDDTPNAVFNPWLEARFPNGVNSNCMTCHRRAVWAPQNPTPAFLPITRGTPADNDAIFKGGTKADFLWSLLLEGNQ